MNEVRRRTLYDTHADDVSNHEIGVGINIIIIAMPMMMMMMTMILLVLANCSHPQDT